jgi:hypothetical protein
LIREGQNPYFVLIAGTIGFGFLLMIHPKYSYFGATLMSITIVFLIALYTLQIYLRMAFLYNVLASFSISTILVLGLHFMTRTRTVLPQSIALLSVSAYVIMTLFAFYVEGTSAGANPWIIFGSFLLILLQVLVPLNFSFRQNAVESIIDISDFEVYPKIAKEFEDILKNRSDIEGDKIDSDVAKIISELKHSINSFLYENYEGSIIHSYNVREGLDRVFYDWMKMDRTMIFLSEEKEALSFWRQNVAHSNVSKPYASASRRRDEKRKRVNTLENRYIKKSKTDFGKALSSISFTMEAITYIKSSQQPSLGRR